MIMPFLLLFSYAPVTMSMVNPIPTLKELCFDKLKEIPPKQFNATRQLCPDLQSQYIVRCGIPYTPTLFSLITNQCDNDQPRISGEVPYNLNLKLANRFTNLFINKENPTSSTHERELSSALYTFAYLHHENLYIGTQSGNIVHYSINSKTPQLIDIQNIADRAIMQIAAHPTIEHLISCKFANGSVVILRKDSKEGWQQLNQIIADDQNIVHPNIKHMSFCPSDGFFACATESKVYVYDMRQKDDAPQKLKELVCSTDSIEALMFDHHKNLIIQGHKGLTKIQQLFVWQFQSKPNASLYTIWPNGIKITLNQDGYYNSLLDEDTLNETVNRILFVSSLSQIKTVEELECFKKYEGALICGEQPLFKVAAIRTKTLELQKKDSP